ncbi:hydrolase [Thermococcus sp.]|uniref:HAD family hydrolase n=1 Tax=Thermococcus sp. TaxID=35749 RepID=UPI00261F89C1|nr:hydrolase [Thermococcus sp.]
MWVVFDVDGTLIDVGESYDLAVKLTVEYFLRAFGVERKVELEWIRKLRSKGSFGDDFKVSEALILFSLAGDVETLVEEFPAGEGIEWVRERFGVGMHRGSIERVFNTFYLGEAYPGRLFDFPGLWRREKPLIEAELLRKLSEEFKVGVVTGRSELELRLAEKILGFRFERAVTRELGLKPNPDLLWELVNGERGVYVGDTLNDELFVENYRRKYGDFDFVMVGRDVEDVSEFVENLLEGGK